MGQGSVANNIGIKHALESLLKRPFVTPRLNAVFAGCLGVAVYDQRLAVEARKAKLSLVAEKFDVSDLTRRIEDAEVSLIERKDVKKVG